MAEAPHIGEVATRLKFDFLHAVRALEAAGYRVSVDSDSIAWWQPDTEQGFTVDVDFGGFGLKQKGDEGA